MLDAMCFSERHFRSNCLQTNDNNELQVELLNPGNCKIMLNLFQRMGEQGKKAQTLQKNAIQSADSTVCVLCRPLSKRFRMKRGV